MLRLSEKPPPFLKGAETMIWFFIGVMIGWFIASYSSGDIYIGCDDEKFDKAKIAIFTKSRR